MCSPSEVPAAGLMSSEGEPMSTLLDQKIRADVPKWWESAGCSQDRALQPAPMGNSKLKLNKNKYTHTNKTVSARAEFTVFCTGSGVSGEG